MVPLSVLDLAPIAEGSNASQALRNTLDLARHAERLGYRRFWLAEHHNMEGIASAATAVVIAHVAGGTSTIRVGAGGIMLPNHAPLVVAEQFGTLATLFPGRIDLGVGGVFEKFPHALGIVNSHHILRADGQFSAEGKQIYNVMKSQPNVQLMTSGHIKDHRLRRTDKFEGNVIHSILADYQHDSEPGCFGGCGYMRLWHFSPAKNELFVRTYSPSLKKFWVSPAEQFELKVDLSAARGVFEQNGSATTTTKTLTYAVGGLEPGRTYEWYAEVEDCGATKRTEVASFVTK